MNLNDSNTFPVTIVRQERITILSCVRQVLKETFHIYNTMITMITMNNIVSDKGSFSVAGNGHLVVHLC